MRRQLRSRCKVMPGVRLGFNVGAMYDVNEHFTVGVSYRSKVTARVKEGEISLKYANEEHFAALVQQINGLLGQLPEGLGLPAGIGIPPLNEGTFAAELPLPSNWNVGIAYRPNRDWTVSGEVQFVGWGAYEALDVHFSPSSLSQYDIHADKRYKNSRIYRLGAEYAATPRLDVRLGAYWDESPVEEDYLNPETPSMNKLGITAGLQFPPDRPPVGGFLFFVCDRLRTGWFLYRRIYVDENNTEFGARIQDARLWRTL